MGLPGADALFARALALEDAGRTEEALEHYRALLSKTPQHADARHNHGLLLARLGRLAEAEHSHRAYLAAHPGTPRARNDLADVLLALGRYDEVRELLEGTEDCDSLVRHGVASACLRRFPEARSAFAAARARHPQQLGAFLRRLAPSGDPELLLSPENIFIARQFLNTGDCNWAGWETYVAEMRRAAADGDVALEPAAAFMALHLPLSPGEQRAIAAGIAARIERASPPLPQRPRRERARLRVGLLSPDLREHLNAYLLLPFLELIDRARFETYVYSLAPDDGSEVRRRVSAAAGTFRDLARHSDGEAAAAIYGDEIDVLLDVGGYTAGARFAIPAQRPAFVQASYLAFPGSLGSSRIDYAIVDRMIAPREDEWSESLVHLPSTFFLYDFRETCPEAPLHRRDYGLPPDAFVFCAFHKAEKISPDTFTHWMRILGRTPGSVLWLRSQNGAAVRNLRAQAARAAIDPQRLLFAPFDPRSGHRYFARHRLGDLMLDALHHSAITSACDALGAGLPLLTLRGSTMASRAGESLLRAAGLPELVAEDREAFVESAVRLASHPGELARLRDRLQGARRAAPLFDTAGRVRELETACEEMVRAGPRAAPL